jgi:hypothetical protein
LDLNKDTVGALDFTAPRRVTTRTWSTAPA